MPVDIRKPLKKFTPILIDARDQDLNEADTVQRICRFLRMSSATIPSAT